MSLVSLELQAPSLPLGHLESSIILSTISNCGYQKLNQHLAMLFKYCIFAEFLSLFLLFTQKARLNI